MSDHTSTARELATEIGCSVATVNGKASTLGIKLKGRTPEEHKRLVEAMRGVKPRKRKAKTKIAKKVIKKRKGPINGATPDFAGNLKAYFSHGKELIAEVRRRLDELEKEKSDLNEKLDALLLLHPNSR